MNTKIRKIVVAGVMGAISIFLGLTRLGFIPWITGVALTVMHVPVIIGAVLEGPLVGGVTGLIFGGFSLIWASIGPTGIFDPIFVNPLVSIVPRIFIGPAAWLVYVMVKKFKEIPSFIAAGITGSLTNTILVLCVLGLLQKLPWISIATIAVANGLPEAALAAALTVAVVTSWKGIETRRRGSSV